MLRYRWTVLCSGAQALCHLLGAGQKGLRISAGITFIHLSVVLFVSCLYFLNLWPVWSPFVFWTSDLCYLPLSSELLTYVICLCLLNCRPVWSAFVFWTTELWDLSFVFWTSDLCYLPLSSEPLTCVICLCLLNLFKNCDSVHGHCHVTLPLIINGHCPSYS